MELIADKPINAIRMNNLKSNQYALDYIKGIFVIFVFCVLPWIISQWISFFEIIAFWFNALFLYYSLRKTNNNTKFSTDIIALGQYCTIEKIKEFLLTIKEFLSIIASIFVAVKNGIVVLLVTIAILGGIVGLLVFGWKQLI